MKNRTKIIVISCAAVLLAAGITVGIISLKGKKTDPDNGSSISQSLPDKENNNGEQKLVSSVSQDDNTVSDDAISDGENGQTGDKTITDTSAFQNIADAAACFYYLDFVSTDAISDRDCLDALEAITIEQDVSGSQRFFPVTRGDNMTNSIPVSMAHQLIYELFGKENTSMLDKLSSDGQNVQFMLAGGMGAPTATIKSAEKISDDQTRLLIKFYQENAGGEVTVNQTAYMTVEATGGQYFNYRVVSLAKLNG